MKRLNKKGFTLIELLAVIVVLSIILVITVPIVLNTLGSTRQEALQASADTAAKYYNDRLAMAMLGQKQNGFIVDATLNNTTGKLNSQSGRCISKEEANILGLNTTDYSINTNCTGTNSLTASCADVDGYSTVSWDLDGKSKVKLIGKTGGKFENGNKILSAISNQSGNNVLTFDKTENLVLSGTNGEYLNQLKVYGNTVDGVGDYDSATGKYIIPITVSGKNIANFPQDNLLESIPAETKNYIAIGDQNSGTLEYDTQYVVRFDYEVLDNSITYRIGNAIGNKVGGIAYVPFTGSTYYVIYNANEEKTSGTFEKVVTTKSSANVDLGQYSYLTYGIICGSGYKQASANTYTGSIKITNVMLAKYYGDTYDYSYEPYQTPQTYEIKLSAPLRSNGEKSDYIDFETRRVIRWFDSDGTLKDYPTEDSDVELPAIETLNGTTIISADTAIKPLFSSGY